MVFISIFHTWYNIKRDSFSGARGNPGDAELRVQTPADHPPREGIAIIDVDPASENFGSILLDIPLPRNLVNHHIFYNKDASKAYLTALGQSDLHVVDMTRYPYRITKVGVPECLVGEDIIFSDDNKKWFLTCIGSSKVIVGNADTDELLKIISPSKPYPHGIAINEDIDRMIITSSVRPSDLGDPGELCLFSRPVSEKSCPVINFPKNGHPLV